MGRNSKLDSLAESASKNFISSLVDLQRFIKECKGDKESYPRSLKHAEKLLKAMQPVKPSVGRLQDYLTLENVDGEKKVDTKVSIKDVGREGRKVAALWTKRSSVFEATLERLKADEAVLSAYGKNIGKVSSASKMGGLKVGVDSGSREMQRWNDSVETFKAEIIKLVRGMEAANKRVGNAGVASHLKKQKEWAEKMSKQLWIPLHFISDL